ncbi:phosphatase PAP2 family protein [Pedobacter sp. MC2016-14]|uniref:phosphatase PAP2 family protein n=1 Tax=Pedobacter sp. MC2016-14 TaxID=2897327 RepID=UPI001E2E367D|nr:phosphatase PAP2 family protein [Pedobacter sp. MC2016-14]MCD0489757.1 phosphatase PAP2 family protein [Pedobacter sp. MC2016-14]
MPKDLPTRQPFITAKNLLITTAISLFYLLLSRIMVGYKSDQLVLVAIFNGCFYISVATRKFILGFSIFIVYWILFDYMKAFPNYLFHSVSIEELYNLEKHMFGIHLNGTILTPNEYWKVNSNTFIDVLSGFFYLMWIPVPLAFAAFMFFKNRKQFLLFSFTFVLVNLLGFIVYYAYPAAPPWYVQLHGFKFHAHTPGNTGGLIRFDHFFNLPVFQSIYSKGSNVFAAMPSLHSSYPVIVLYYGWKNKLGALNVFFFVVMIGIWFTAVYTSHHYVLDVLAGITTACIGILLFNWLSTKTKLRVLIDNMFKAIS